MLHSYMLFPSEGQETIHSFSSILSEKSEKETKIIWLNSLSLAF